MSNILDPAWKAGRKPTDYQIILSYLDERKTASGGQPFELPSHVIEIMIPTYAYKVFRKRVMGGTIARRWREIKAQNMLAAIGLEITSERDDEDTGWRTWTLAPTSEKEVAS